MALSTALKTAMATHFHGIGNAEELALAVDNATPAGTNITSTAAELNSLHGLTAGTVTASKPVVAGSVKNLDTLAVANLVSGADVTAGAITQSVKIIGRKALVDNTATSILTVTCPNGEHCAAVKITLLCAVTKTSGGTFESARVAEGLVVFDRTTGAALVGTAATLALTAIATSGTDTLTLAYSLGTVSGAVGATNTMDIKVTGVGSGTDSEVLTFVAELINSEASGVSMAAV